MKYPGLFHIQLIEDIDPVLAENYLEEVLRSMGFAVMFESVSDQLEDAGLFEEYDTNISQLVKNSILQCVDQPEVPGGYFLAGVWDAEDGVTACYLKPVKGMALSASQAALAFCEAKGSFS